MQFSASFVAAASLLLSTGSAHLIMQTPKQWTVSSPQAPLASDGSDFPCQNGTPEDSVADYEPGSTQTLQLIGSAVHGGGSAQMLITYDTAPTADSVWRVMQSWEGNHPVNSAEVNNGNYDADPTRVLPALSFTVPSGLPSGKAVVAWSWFNKVGNREHYMKCATVTIGGSSSDKSGFESLPTMMRGNDGNGCTVPENIQAIKFKNPGPSVIGTGDTAVDCDDSEAGTGSSSGGSGSAATTAAGATTLATSTTAAGFGLGVSATLSVGGLPTGGSGYQDGLASAASSVAAAATTTTAVAAYTTTTAAAAAATTAAAGAASPAASGATCVEGKITCNSDGTWTLCGSGLEHNMGPGPAGMECVDGAFTALPVATATAASYKRSVRFSPAHMKRGHSVHVPAKRLAHLKA